MWLFRMWCEVPPMWAEALAWGHSPKITQLLSGKVGFNSSSSHFYSFHCPKVSSDKLLSPPRSP